MIAKNVTHYLEHLQAGILVELISLTCLQVSTKYGYISKFDYTVNVW